MTLPEKVGDLLQNMSNDAAARRFVGQLIEKHPNEFRTLQRGENAGLFTDLLALAAASDFLATTVLLHPEHIAWLKRQRRNQQIKTKEDLLESIGRFALTNSTLDAHVLLARFRRRELLRIYLSDLRGLATVAEITLELSNLADACLEFALRLARQEVENRFGAPLEIDSSGRAKIAGFAVVALGKLGSRELNYASDIDLLFLYSADGVTANAATNREFFGKLAERISKIVGQNTNEGAAYRVDLRLRPHGRVGALAIPVAEAAHYYHKTARDWERQVLLRSRDAAGDAEVFKSFRAAVENQIFRPNINPADALENVRQSKLKINLEKNRENGFNVKTGAGGIREIEFIAQALQLAYGGADEWLRAAHTLIALERLTERDLLTTQEYADLSNAYAFLRTLEHRLQMRQGLQTHVIPPERDKRLLVAQTMNFNDLTDFDLALQTQTAKVNRVFVRVFEERSAVCGLRSAVFENQSATVDSREKPEAQIKEQRTKNKEQGLQTQNLTNAVREAANLHDELAVLRVERQRVYDEIIKSDRAGEIELGAVSKLQTDLAETSLQAAQIIVKKELARKFANDLQFEIADLKLLALGKLASRGMDYGSDLDLILVYDDKAELPVGNLTPAEFYSRAAEILLTALSSLTREGFCYRVDLRLRPDGKNGRLAVGETAFLNYAETRAAVWEWLAYVKLRGVNDDAISIEQPARKIIHERARQIAVADLRSETARVRDLLEQQKTKNLRRGEIDLKYAAGGLLDVYFAARFLQLRDDVPDENQNRSTVFTLERLRENNSLDHESYEILRAGYEFLRKLDHQIRLTAERSTRLPADANNKLLIEISRRLQFDSTQNLLHEIALHTIEIRRVYSSLFVQ